MKSVSCIIPIYGLSAGSSFSYFEKLVCSLSVASKVLNNNYELIIVNDDITRISRESVERIVSSYSLSSNLIYIENSINQGQAYSRNEGVKQSTCDFLHFIDQDDYVSDNFYDDFLESGNNDDIFFSKPFFLKDGEIRPAYTKWLERSYKRAHYINELWYLLISNLAYSPGQVIISKKAYSMAGGFPVLKNRGADDFAMFFNMVFNKQRFSINYIERSSFYYRIHNQQNSKLNSTNDSACEFLRGYKPKNYKEKIIVTFKKSNYLGILNYLFYICFYKRAK